MDFSELSYTDSSGLNLIFDTTRSLRDREWLGVIGPSSGVHKLLEMAGLTYQPCFRMLEDLDSVALTG